MCTRALTDVFGGNVTTKRNKLGYNKTDPVAIIKIVIYKICNYISNLIPKC